MFTIKNYKNYNFSKLETTINSQLINIPINRFQFKIWNYFNLHYYIIAVAYLWCNNSALPRKRLVVGEWRIIHWPRDFGQSMRSRNRFDDPTIIITLEAVDCQGWHVIMILARNWVIAPHGRVRPFLGCSTVNVYSARWPDRRDVNAIETYAVRKSL